MEMKAYVDYGLDEAFHDHESNSSALAFGWPSDSGSDQVSNGFSVWVKIIYRHKKAQ